MSSQLSWLKEVGQGPIALKKKRYFNPYELVTLGVFAATSKLVTLVIALAGGGPNPISLILKNLVFTTLLIVMLYKLRKFGTLTLYMLVANLVSFLLLGGGFTSIIVSVLSAVFTEIMVSMCGGVKRSYAPFLAVFIFDILSRLASLGASYVFLRETPAMMVMVVVIMAVGYIGAFLGIFTGIWASKELTKASIIKTSVW